MVLHSLDFVGCMLTVNPCPSVLCVSCKPAAGSGDLVCLGFKPLDKTPSGTVLASGVPLIEHDDVTIQNSQN